MNADLTVVDVYESAAAIGRELEKLIDAVGSDLVADLMPRVIAVLEQLEVCVKQREDESGEVQKMQEELRQTRHECAFASNENLRLIKASDGEEANGSNTNNEDNSGDYDKEEDVKQLNSQGQKEIRDWMAMAKELERENKGLKTQLSEKEGIVDREKAQEQQAMKILYQLKDTVDGQRDKLRSKDDEIRTRVLEVDALQQHVDRLAKVTADLRRKNELLSTVAKNFIQEKSELQSELRAMGKATTPTMVGSPVHHGAAGGDVVDGSRQDKTLFPDDMKDKMIIDLKDPDRPRFTLLELQTVLQERDELKLDILELEDELVQYRPIKKQESLVAESEEQQRRLSNTSKAKSDPSGIKKLFGFLFRAKDKPATVTQGECTWEFLEKPSHEVTDVKVRRATCSSVNPSTSIDIPEENPGDDDSTLQRGRSYTGPTVQVSQKEPFKRRERMTCIRTDSKQLVELGQDVTSLINGESALAAQLSQPVTVATHPLSQPMRRSDSFLSSGSLDEIGGAVEEIMLDDISVAGDDGETSGDMSPGQQLGQNPKIVIDDNGNQETELEV